MTKTITKVVTLLTEYNTVAHHRGKAVRTPVTNQSAAMHAARVPATALAPASPMRCSTRLLLRLSVHALPCGCLSRADVSSDCPFTDTSSLSPRHASFVTTRRRCRDLP